MTLNSVKGEDRTVSPRITPPHGEEFPSSRHLKWAFAALLVYFGLRLVFYSVSISSYVPPDEVTHFGRSRVFSHFSFMPQNSPETYEFGLVTNIPWLYYWVMGKLLELNFFGIPDLIFLRLLNVPLAFATVYFVWRILRLLTDDRLSQLLLVVAMTNTIMFTFLSASVSYDNLTNLLAAMSVYYLLAFFKHRRGDLLAASLLCQTAGGLTKITFLPLILVLNALLFIYEFRGLCLLPAALAGWFRAADWRRAGLVLGVVGGLVLNIQLYGGNYYNYGSLEPDMDKVISQEAALHYRVSARNMIFTLFKEGRISGKEALDLAAKIKHPDDREDTIYFMDNYLALKYGMKKWVGPIEYFRFWVWYMSAGIFGIFGHYHMFNTGPTLWPFAALGILTGIGIVIRWRPSDAAWLPTCLMVIFVFYALFLMFYENYQAYRYFGEISLTVQGRYLFPVLGAIYSVSSYYLLRLFRGRGLRLTLLSAACIIFISLDLPFFLMNVTSDWFIPGFH
jgi:hypothetical protein